MPHIALVEVAAAGAAVDEEDHATSAVAAAAATAGASEAEQTGGGTPDLQEARPSAEAGAPAPVSTTTAAEEGAALAPAPLLPPAVALPPEVLAFLPWQHQLAVLALLVLAGQEPSLGQLVSLCLWPQLQCFTTHRVGSTAQPPLLATGCQLLQSCRVAYTHSVWRARLMVAAAWLAASETRNTMLSEGAVVLHTGGEGLLTNSC